MRNPETSEEWLFFWAILAVGIPMAGWVAYSSRHALSGFIKALVINPAIKKHLLDQEHRLVVNPVKGVEKIMRFEEDGRISKGQDKNEASWRIHHGYLEILNQQGDTHSRFRFNASRKSLEHTNEMDTISIRGQTLKPVTAPPST